MTAQSTQVWRLAAFGRSLATVIAAVLAMMSVAAWVMAAVRTSAEGALMALAITGVAAVVGMVIWWMALRPRLMIDDRDIVVVNPWGTQRVAIADVVAVTRGMQGARLELRSGWSVTAFALAEVYGGLPERGRRIEEVAGAISARQRALGVR